MVSHHITIRWSDRGPQTVNVDLSIAMVSSRCPKRARATSIVFAWLESQLAKAKAII